MAVCAIVCGVVFGFIEDKFLNSDGKPFYLTFSDGLLLFVGFFTIMCIAFKNKYSL